MLSIIVPVFNEVQSLRDLYMEIRPVCEKQAIPYEVIFVDDGSDDGSWKMIEELASNDPHVAGIRFRRNFGKASALAAGMCAARGKVLLTMDADLQDDPAEIPRFLETLERGYDVVNGWKQHRLDPWHKVYPSRVFNRLVGWMTGLKLHDHNCGLKAFRSEVAAEIRLYGELHRFIPVLAHARGFKVTEIPVNHRKRKFGQSKYDVRRFSRALLDILTVKFLTGFGHSPQHLLGAAGLLFFGLGMLGLAYLAGLWLLMNVAHVVAKTPIGTRPLLAYSLASTLLGAQAISVGLLAELVVAYAARDWKAYSIAAEVGSRER